MGAWLACGLAALVVGLASWLLCRKRRRVLADMAQIGEDDLDN